MATIEYKAEWNVVENATSYDVRWSLNGEPITDVLSVDVLTDSLLIDVVDGDIIKVEVAGRNATGRGPIGKITILATVLPTPVAPEVTLLQV